MSHWSIAALPLGSGRIRTAHGSLPVPTPATALLLQGFVVQDDGREGERVTPTGAAILKHLAPFLPPARTGHGDGSHRHRLRCPAEDGFIQAQPGTALEI